MTDGGAGLVRQLPLTGNHVPPMLVPLGSSWHRLLTCPHVVTGVTPETKSGLRVSSQGLQLPPRWLCHSLAGQAQSWEASGAQEGPSMAGDTWGWQWGQL